VKAGEQEPVGRGQGWIRGKGGGRDPTGERRKHI